MADAPSPAPGSPMKHAQRRIYKPHRDSPPLAALPQPPGTRPEAPVCHAWSPALGSVFSAGGHVPGVVYCWDVTSEMCSAQIWVQRQDAAAAGSADGAVTSMGVRCDFARAPPLAPHPDAHVVSLLVSPPLDAPGSPLTLAPHPTSLSPATAPLPPPVPPPKPCSPAARRTAASPCTTSARPASSRPSPSKSTRHAPPWCPSPSSPPPSPAASSPRAGPRTSASSTCAWQHRARRPQRVPRMPWCARWLPTRATRWWPWQRTRTRPSSPRRRRDAW